MEDYTGGLRVRKSAAVPAATPWLPASSELRQREAQRRFASTMVAWSRFEIFGDLERTVYKPNDTRYPSEHDVDRILYSDELRRLGQVTQVVAVGEMPLFHTRLTHTLKVQQLSRRIAEYLERHPGCTEAIEAIGGIDVDAAEAAGLAHDLGHPPFGHVGEAALNECCREAGLDGFEGNAQSFRIVTKLARRGEVPEFGLGLGARSLRGILKYPWLRQGDHEDAAKWNVYATEAAEFERVCARAEPGVRSIEAAIMDWADDITYAVHDLEDFIRSGRVPVAKLATSPVELDSFTDRALKRLTAKHTNIDWDEAVRGFSDLIFLCFGQFGTYRGTRDELAQLRSVCAVLIDLYVRQVDVSEVGEPLVIPPGARGEIELFKQLTWHYVIHDPALATLQEGQAVIVRRLYKRLLTWLADAEKGDEIYRIPQRLRDMYAVTEREPGRATYGGNKSRRQARAVADYIASLTETQAVDLYERLTGAGGHSVLDPWLTY